MAAAYAALVSLRHIIEQIEHHPHPPISLDKSQIQSLTEKLTFLQDFLECYSVNGGSKEADHHHVLESQIADAAYAAEDVIESHTVDQIQAHASTTTHGKKTRSINFLRGLFKYTSHVEKISSTIDLHQGLQKVIQDLDLIMKEVMEITKKTIFETNQQQMNYSMSAAPSSSSPVAGQNATMVGFDDVLIEVMDKLTGQQSNRQIIPIVGMGGIGKTTLARNIYVNPLIVQYFDCCGWATISQEYNAKEILLQALLCLKTIGSGANLSKMSEHELGEILYRNLSGRRYLIVMDDMWSIEAWEKVKFFFPDNDNGSRIVITTRMSNLAFELSGSCGFEMSFLNEDKSWNLFRKSVFGEGDCPIELEEIGKKISNNCKGLPLSIVVIGGLLAKSKQTRQHWEYISENLNSIVNLEDSERCLKTLRLSYNQLPVHLKPCFLYMGMFPEDHKIRVSKLIRLWVAEGFLKPIRGKIFEVVAKEYLNDLIDRNLILVHKLGSAGNTRLCTIHDLLRDLCIKEAEKDKFLRVAETKNPNIGQSWHTQRRIGIHGSTSNRIPRVLHRAMQSASLVRSLMCNTEEVVTTHPFKLLRVLNPVVEVEYFEATIAYPLKDIFQLVNSRYLSTFAEIPNSRFPSSVYHIWNLQTLVVNYADWNVVSGPPFDIWKMPQLRHVKLYKLHLPDPDPTMDARDDFVVLENLQTLSMIRNFKCGEEVVKRIPNIKKLGINYGYHLDLSPFFLDNLCRLRKLESLSCSFNISDQSLHDLNFPHSLRKLTLKGTNLHWDDMATKIGSLPHLQVLKVYENSFIGPEWETVEGQFQSLKYLLLYYCSDLENWTTESAHFPCLEHIILRDLRKLKEIPLGIGDILTLQSIQLHYCSESAVISAKEIIKEQEDLGNEGLQVQVKLWEKNEALESLASPSFQVEAV